MSELFLRLTMNEMPLTTVTYPLYEHTLTTWLNHVSVRMLLAREFVLGDDHIV